jgi:plastocyanin
MKSLARIFSALALCLSFATPGRGAFYTNIIQSFSFDPPTRTITAGDTVVWVNLDGVGHTVTGDFEKEPICGPGFLYQGGVCMRSFNTAGTFTYHCEPHESMVGTIVVDSAGNIPPSVFISSPANGASFTGPTNVLIRATAIDPDGAVLNVTFFDSATPLGSDTSPPFEVNRNLGPGQHILTAIAFDDSGEQATSFPVRVTINPPLRILRLSLGTNPVLTSTPTNYVNVHPEYITNLNSTNWLALTVRSNRLANGALETFCGQPAGNSVFIRIRSAP